MSIKQTKLRRAITCKIQEYELYCVKPLLVSGDTEFLKLKNPNAETMEYSQNDPESFNTLNLKF